MAAVEWQITCTDLKQRGALLLQTEDWCDCVFLVGANETQFRGHKLMLAMASPVFESMFFVESLDDSETFRITDIDPEAFRAMVNYIYTENININSFETACKVYHAASQYMILQLARVCAEFMVCTLGMETACIGYEAGNRSQDQMLMNESLQMIRMHIKEILHHKSFEESSIDTVAKIFSIEDLRVEETELYLALERWARANQGRKRSADQSGQRNGNSPNLRKALEQIRFLNFSLEQFASGPARSGLMSSAEALAVLVNIAGADTPLPTGFSDIRQPRFQPPRAVPPVTVTEPTRAVLRLSVPAASCERRSAVAPPAPFRSAQWTLRVRPVTQAYTSGTASLGLGVYLRCERSEPGPWSYAVCVEFVLIAFGTNPLNRSTRLNETFTSECNEHGVDTFVLVEQVCGTSSAYNNNGTLTFEARVDFEPYKLGAPSGSGQK